MRSRTMAVWLLAILSVFEVSTLAVVSYMLAMFFWPNAGDDAARNFASTVICTYILLAITTAVSVQAMIQKVVSGEADVRPGLVFFMGALVNLFEFATGSFLIYSVAAPGREVSFVERGKGVFGLAVSKGRVVGKTKIPLVFGVRLPVILVEGEGSLRPVLINTILEMD